MYDTSKCFDILYFVTLNSLCHVCLCHINSFQWIQPTILVAYTLVLPSCSQQCHLSQQSLIHHSGLIWLHYLLQNCVFGVTKQIWGNMDMSVHANVTEFRCHHSTTQPQDMEYKCGYTEWIVIHSQKGALLQFQSKMVDQQQLLGMFLATAGLVTVVYFGISFKICMWNGWTYMTVIWRDGEYAS
jgi:hypothetical protein